ncbi:acetylglutamate kinase [Clostridium sp. MB40-C1]|uniref:acetylglutamate kinase n=1 Tax=Clostridium sp. MB40-C1 TaxID=3070996 RepID=UPI0027DEEC5E|nr:acetylglutamate kinase [Clostridium sp. MB40-C1]WMJ80725.1 acetylglutamate kinase [Clostridium sp. MB40-C1]
MKNSISLKSFKGKIFVIKFGGSIMKNPNAQKVFFKNILKMHLLGINLVIVHGGGPEISKWLKKIGIESKFINGLRITDKSSMEIIEMVLSGKLNKNISAFLSNKGVKAIGLSGSDNNLIVAKKKYLNIDNKQIDIGYVGEIESINTDLLSNLLIKGYVPIISPIGYDKNGNKYNINADYAASFISSKLKAEKLIFISDVEGIYKNINDKSSLINSITINEIKDYINCGIIKDGMIPKMESCIKALENGTKSIHLVDGRKDDGLIGNILYSQGTKIMIKDDVNKCVKII